jgi:hypothetical protein
MQFEPGSGKSDLTRLSSRFSKIYTELYLSLTNERRLEGQLASLFTAVEKIVALAGEVMIELPRLGVLVGRLSAAAELEIALRKLMCRTTRSTTGRGAGVERKRKGGKSSLKPRKMRYHYYSSSREFRNSHSMSSKIVYSGIRAQLPFKLP